MKPILILALLTLTAAGCGTSGDRPIAPVSIQALLTVLPEPLDWQREKPNGERVTTPLAFADASVRMMKGDATVTAKITDTGLNEILVAPFAAALAGDFTRETEHGYEKSIAVGDARGVERWDSGTRTGNLSIIVARRFVVEIDGSTIDSPKVLHDILEKIDLKKLADLK